MRKVVVEAGLLSRGEVRNALAGLKRLIGGFDFVESRGWVASTFVLVCREQASLPVRDALLSLGIEHI